MNVEIARLPESRVTLKIELTPDEVDQALDRTYKQLVQRVTIPGFRKGKAPRSVVERMLGTESFLHEATDEAVRWGYRKAVDQENLIPLDQAEIDVPGEEEAHTHLHPGEPFVFEATVSVRPEVDLPDYHAITVEAPTVEVSDEDVTNLVVEIQNRNATFEPVQRPAQIGDVLTMNVNAKVDGEEIVNEENGEFELIDEEVGESNPLFPGLSAELVGTVPGDIREVRLDLPADYPQPEMAGKTMFLTIVGKEVKRKVLPKIDDELAQSVSQYQTLDELRDVLRSNIEAERRQEADQQLVRDSIEALVSRTFLDIPPILVGEELDRMINDLNRSFEQQGVSFEMYLQAVGKSEEGLREEMREGATQNVKTSLVLGALADAENIEVESTEIDAALDEAFRGMQLSTQERKRLRRDNSIRSNIRARLRRQRAIRELVRSATGEEVSEETADAVADETTGIAEERQETAAVEIGG